MEEPRNPIVVDANGQTKMIYDLINDPNRPIIEV